LILGVLTIGIRTASPVFMRVPGVLQGRLLNTGRKALPAACESSVTFRGNDQSIIYIDWWCAG